MFTLLKLRIQRAIIKAILEYSDPKDLNISQATSYYLRYSNLSLQINQLTRTL
jgi:hypothetical protein